MPGTRDVLLYWSRVAARSGADTAKALGSGLREGSRAGGGARDGLGRTLWLLALATGGIFIVAAVYVWHLLRTPLMLEEEAAREARRRTDELSARCEALEGEVARLREERSPEEGKSPAAEQEGGGAHGSTPAALLRANIEAKIAEFERVLSLCEAGRPEAAARFHAIDHLTRAYVDKEFPLFGGYGSPEVPAESDQAAEARYGEGENSRIAGACRHRIRALEEILGAIE
jgi:hypothetical protein